MAADGGSGGPGRSPRPPRRALPRYYPLVVVLAVVISILAVVWINRGERANSTGGSHPSTSAATPSASGTDGGGGPSSSPGKPSPRGSGTPSRPQASSITMAFTGDMLPSDALRARAHQDAGGHGYTFKSMLSTVAPLIRNVDFAVCHQETPISDNDQGLHGWPQFNGPWELAGDEKWAGYDACDTASNHTVDFGQQGVDATLDELDKFEIKHTGSYRSAADADKLTMYDVKGVRVGHIAVTYGTNGLPDPHPWTVNLLDPAKVRADAHQLKQDGADIVLVSVHAGIELDQSPSAYQVQMDSEIMRSPDVDLIVGCHAHVVQPIKKLADGHWIIYGLGNFLAQQDVPADDPTPPHRDGVIVEPTFSKVRGKWTITRMGFIPTFVNAPSDHVELAPAFSKARTVKALTADGAPLTDLTPR